MNKLRDLIQAKLEEIQNLEVTSEIPDSMLEEDTTYFSYNLQKTYISSDHDKNYTYRINLTGYIKRLENPEENTLEITDKIADEIENKLKELNIKSSYIDITVTDGIRKKQVTGETIYNEIDNRLA
jgi:hypothetical protein